MLDARHGQFLNSVLPWVAFKRGKATVKQDARGSCQECPACGARVKKSLSERWHHCSCGCSVPRDIASGIVLRNRFQERCRADSAENAPWRRSGGGAFRGI